MSDLGDLQQAIESAVLASRNQKRCTLCIALGKLEPAKRAVVLKGVNSTIGGQTLARILRKNGMDVGKPAILTHRSEGHK